MNDKDLVDESTHYDNCLDVANDRESKSVKITDFLDEDIIIDDSKEWEKHWVGMPDFKQENKSTYKTIYVHFRNEEDYKEFSSLIDQNLTIKTKSIWHPKLDRTANSLMRWIEDDKE